MTLQRTTPECLAARISSLRHHLISLANLTRKPIPSQFNPEVKMPIAGRLRSDGATRSVEKTHALKLDHVRWLLEPMPSVLIISFGWDGAVHPLEELKEFKECEVQFLKTGEAIEEYNRLKGDGQRVAIHVHSTC
jgi:hypothetical protein